QRAVKGSLIRRRQGYAVTRAATCKVTGACPAVALCEGGKTLPLSDRSEGALTILRSFEIASNNLLFLF
ncbi:MAG: hypothetical protein IJV93_14555, partial [Lentisphaeria bacterium]|nr:hypothetical protein [Lentisphaeria bacterium]